MKAQSMGHGVSLWGGGGIGTRGQQQGVRPPPAGLVMRIPDAATGRIAGSKRLDCASSQYRGQVSCQGGRFPRLVTVITSGHSSLWARGPTRGGGGSPRPRPELKRDAPLHGDLYTLWATLTNPGFPRGGGLKRRGGGLAPLFSGSNPSRNLHEQNTLAQPRDKTTHFLHIAQVAWLRVAASAPASLTHAPSVKALITGSQFKGPRCKRHAMRPYPSQWALRPRTSPQGMVSLCVSMGAASLYISFGGGIPVSLHKLARADPPAGHVDLHWGAT